MGGILLSILSTVVGAVILFFVIKWAVKAGINESLLVTDAQRERQKDEGLK